jgi:hypothetical protein
MALVPAPAFASECADGWTSREYTNQCDLILQTSDTVVVPDGVTDLGYLLVAGGGGGGSGNGQDANYLAGGGGGAGGVQVGELEVSSGDTLVVTVGAGGGGGYYNSEDSTAYPGTDGGNSLIVRNGFPLAGVTGGGVGSNATLSESGAGGTSGNSNSGGTGYWDAGSGYAAGGGGGGSTSPGVNGAYDNGGDGGAGAFIDGTVVGLPNFSNNNFQISRDTSSYPDLHPFIFFYGIGFGGGGGVTVDGEVGICDGDVLGRSATPSYGDTSNHGSGSCGFNDGYHNASSSLLEATKFPGQGGNGGSGYNAAGPGLDDGSDGVPGIVWLTYALSSPGSFIEIDQEYEEFPVLVGGDDIPYLTDAPEGSEIRFYLPDGSYATIAHNPESSTFPWSETGLGVLCADTEAALELYSDETYIDYAWFVLEGNSLNVGCWGMWDVGIKPENEFMGAQLDQVLVDEGNPASRSFEIDDWESEYTGDAFDDFGVVLIGDTILAPEEGDCTFIGDGEQVTELVYDGDPNSNVSNGDFSQILVSCDLPGIEVGAGTIDFKVELKIQGSTIGWYLYTTAFTGSPGAFVPAIAGNLGSDEDTYFEDLGESANYYSFISYGDREDPIIGYRSNSEIDRLKPDYPDEVTLQSAAAISPAAGENLVFMLELWLVDYDSSYESEAIDVARDFGASDFDFGHCLASVASSNPTLDNQCGELQPVPYFGPVVTNDPQTATSGGTVTYTGSDLDDVTSATIAGQSATIVSKSPSTLTLRVPTGLAQGMHDVDLHYSTTEVLTLQNGLIIENPIKVWTQLQTDNTVKMYAKNIIGEGKIQFFHNGNEIAWVRASNALNPKLREANGSHYLVRTRELVAGKNAFEIYQDGTRIWRAAYSR